MVSKRQKRHTKPHKKPYLPLLIILLVAAVFGGTLGFLYLINHPLSLEPSDNSSDTSQSSDSNTTDKGSSPDKSKESDQSSADESVETDNSSEDDNNNSKAPKYEGENANNYADLTGYINYSGIVSGALSIRATISQSVSGTCEFIITSPSGRPFNYVSDIDFGPTSSFCAIDIPTSMLSESGVFKITINLKSSNKSGIITGEVTI